MSPEIVGWASSAVLVATLAAQTWKLYASRTNRGVSVWLYIGELVAAIGFTVYSALLHNIVYMTANSLGALTAVCGLALYVRNRRFDG